MNCLIEIVLAPSTVLRFHVLAQKSSTPISQPSLNSVLMAKRIEAAAELAAK